MAGDDTPSAPETLGRIALKQVRVSRAEAEARARETGGANKTTSNPMNRLVPYLDLFSRLSDDELSRLSRVPISAVEGLRQQVDEVNRALGRYVDLIPRLSDDELARLTGATVKTIRFWRLSQPRHLQTELRPRSDGAVQPMPRRESASVPRGSEDSDTSYSSTRSSTSSSSSSSSGNLRRNLDGDTLTDEHSQPNAAESATFVIDTVE